MIDLTINEAKSVQVYKTTRTLRWFCVAENVFCYRMKERVADDGSEVAANAYEGFCTGEGLETLLNGYHPAQMACLDDSVSPYTDITNDVTLLDKVTF